VYANLTANFVRNLWAYAIIFCGHFPDQAYTFTEEEVEGETPGGWYVRQLIGAANIDGSSTFHVMSGSLSFQVAPRVKEVCERYGLPYNTGPFRKQLGSVQRTILRLAFPGGNPRRKAGPYRRPPEPVEVASPNGDQPTGPLPAFP
jgi:NADPH-dependent stearoyl-CoA 9-desaturase